MVSILNPWTLGQTCSGYLFNPGTADPDKAVPSIRSTSVQPLLDP
jgi:hypothetical protein